MNNRGERGGGQATSEQDRKLIKDRVGDRR